MTSALPMTAANLAALPMTADDFAALPMTADDFAALDDTDGEPMTSALRTSAR